MMYLLTPSAQHLRRLMINRGAAMVSYELGQFADGEFSYRLHEAVRRKRVRIVGSVLPDPASLFHLSALFRLVRENGAADVSVVLPYMGYARQDESMERGALRTGIMAAQMIRNLNPSGIFAIDPHGPAVLEALGPDAQAVSALPTLLKRMGNADDIDVVAAPDAGAKKRAQRIAAGLAAHPEVVWVEKTQSRPGRAAVERLHGTVAQGEVLLVDDMIDTGSTIIQASKRIADEGASSIRVAATHGVFSGQARDALASAPIQEIAVTNTLNQPRGTGIRTVDISPLILGLDA